MVHYSSKKSDVTAKKSLGQHFLIRLDIAEDIAHSIPENNYSHIVEIGPGMGVLTKFLTKKYGEKLHCIELDNESVHYLKHQEWSKNLNVISGDWLHIHNDFLEDKQNTALIGNYPYNISTQIAFTAIENENITFFGGMFQKEVAMRLCAKHGNKDYGITSILLQTYFNTEYLFTVGPECFDPPPKVNSGVIACKRLSSVPPLNYLLHKEFIKSAFSQRRKTMHNSTKSFFHKYQKLQLPAEYLNLRAEQISVEQYIQLAIEYTQILEKN